MSTSLTTNDISGRGRSIRHGIGVLLVLFLPFLAARNTVAQVEHRYYLPALIVGRQIAFASDRAGNFYQDLYLMEPDGTNIVRVPGPDSVMCPAWSPTGDRVAFASPTDQDVWVVGEAGLNLEKISSDLSNEFAPAWSPDGEFVVFAALDVTRGIGMVFIVELGQPGQQLILTAPHTSYLDPDWSPDGSQLAYASNRDGNVEIYVAPLLYSSGSIQVGTSTRITHDVHWDTDPRWSPDGRKIVFTSQRDGDSEIFLMNSNGENAQQMTYNTDIDEDPVWSPDGSQILFTSWRDGNAEIYVMNADGSDQTNLTQSPDRDVCASWRR